VNVVAGAGAGPDVRAAMVSQVRSIMGAAVDVRLHFVNDIPRNARSGKYQLVVCNVPASSRVNEGPPC
jgi:hypothetical protein